MNPAGFPHSEICGSMAICAYPQLIAAYHVFHRLLMPRHSPCALSNLTSLFQVLFSLELLQNYMSKCYLLFEIVVIHFHALPVLYVDNFLLDFLHYSVDNLHLRHEVSKVIAYQICSHLYCFRSTDHRIVVTVIHCYGSP